MVRSRLQWVSCALVLFALASLVSDRTAYGQVPPAWEATPYFQYNIEAVDFDRTTRVTRVFFSVTNPWANDLPWDIKSDTPFTQLAPSAVSRLALDFGWNTREYTNTGSGSRSGPAYPISVDVLKNSTELFPDSGLYVASATLPPQAVGSGVVAIEGHPAWPVNLGGVQVNAPVPVKSAYRYFPITDSVAVARRESVDIHKCMACHDGTDIPRLSLHGSNRTEELRVCVICHNPNQTDIPFRTSGAEESIDFKRMIHGIHAAKKRTNPLIIIGRGGSVNDYSGVQFPAELKNCLNCHIEQPGLGTYQIPLAPSVLGSTIKTRSILGGTLDVDPTNDLKITPVASVCSSCHDSSKAISHMKDKGRAVFGVLQSQIDSGAVRERCVDCHGPGKDKDVRRAHSIDVYGED